MGKQRPVSARAFGVHHFANVNTAWLTNVFRISLIEERC
jgi:hypothetical protein